jgi:uncharacterized protein (TIGR02246 family)
MRSLFLFLGWALLCLAVVLVAEPRLGAKPAPPPAPASSGQAPDDSVIRQVVAAFTKAYNAGDAKGVAGLFIVDGEQIDGEGQRVQGRKAIEDVFAAIFKAHPKAHIDVAIESIRFLGPALAVEEGTSTVKYDPDGHEEAGRYSITYVKQDGRWQAVSVRELPDDESDSSSLEQLAWLVGDWVDEGDDARVKTSYHWTDNHLFLVGDFAVHIAGRPALSGTHRIGWDPLAKQIHSWVFDSEGGFGEALWTASPTDPDSGVVDRWIVKMSGVTHDGRAGSGTNIYTRLGEDRYSYESRDRVVGGAPSEDISEIIVTRAAPGPGSE